MSKHNAITVGIVLIMFFGTAGFISDVVQSDLGWWKTIMLTIVLIQWGLFASMSALNHRGWR